MPVIFKVEEGAIQRYARAVGDSAPLFNDVEYAELSEWGRLMAPPGFVGWPIAGAFDMFQVVEKLIAAGAPRGALDGGVEYEFLAPVGAGDLVVMIARITDISGRETRMGPTMVTTIEITYTNQHGIVALIARNHFFSF